MKKILVIGGAGSLGQMIIRELIAVHRDARVYIGDYKKERGRKIGAELGVDSVCIDKNNLELLKRRLVGFDQVIVATSQKKAIIEGICAELGIDTINVEAYRHLYDKFDSSSVSNSSHIFLGGFCPGLSSIFIKNIYNKFDIVDKVHFSLVQNTSGTNGNTGVLDMLQIINKAKRGKNAFRNKLKLEIGKTPYVVREICHDEEEITREKLKVREIRYFTGWNKVAFTNFIANLKAIKVLGLVINKFNTWNLGKLLVNNNEVEDEEVYLNINYIAWEGANKVEGQDTLWAYSDYGLTATMIALISKYISKEEFVGKFLPMEIMSLDYVLENIENSRLRRIDSYASYCLC